MKKLSLFKQYGRVALVLILGLAIAAASFAFLIPFVGRTTYAAGDPPAALQSQAVDVTTAAVKVEKEVKYGANIAVPTGAKVTAPDGTEYTGVATVPALQMGNYKVSFGEDVTYDYYVRVKLEEEYFLRVDDNGADIPAYVKKGDSFKLPAAHVVYYDKDNILRYYPENQYTVEISDSRGTAYTGTEKTFSAGNTAGKVFLTYTAKLQGETVATGGTKTYSKTFEVNVQSEVPQMGNPSISVSGVAKDVSVNRAVTLPKATATDNVDDNVKVVITVTEPGENNKPGDMVRTVDIDKDGYAYRDPAKVSADAALTTEEGKNYRYVTFDNDKSMTFYPTKEGTYTIKYVAYNDAYKPDSNSTKGKSSERIYYMTASDLVAPVFKSVDEYLIPNTWGLTVKDANGDEPDVYGITDAMKTANNLDNVKANGKIRFTVPEVVDNKDHAPDPDKYGADDKDLISVYFRITDADNSKTIVSFDNILAADDSDDCKFAPNDTYDKDNKGNADKKIVFNKTHDFVFDLTKYNKEVKNEKVSLDGTYTVLYRARDKANNTSSKTYTITVNSEYEDKAAPTTAEVTAPEYISGADKTFNVPYPAYADAEDARAQVVYRLYTDATVAAGENRYIDVKGGEIADIEDGYLVFDKDTDYEQKLCLGNNIYYYVGVRDKVGNFLSNVTVSDESVDLTVYDALTEANKSDYEAALAEVSDKTVVIPDTAGAFTFKTNMTVVKKTGGNEGDPVYAGDNVTLGGFNIVTSADDMRYYTGFEIAVYDPNNDPINVTYETMSLPGSGSGATIVAQNITFNASVAALDTKYYSVYVRVFDVNGQNSVYGYKVTGVNSSPDEHISTSAISTIGSSASTEVTYKLHNEVIDTILGTAGTKAYVVRKISGGVAALMGSEFTAKTQGAYSVQDGYIFHDDVKTDTVNNDFVWFNYLDVNHAGMSLGTYNFNVNDTSAPVIEVQDTMPTYWAKYDETNDETKAKTTVKLPKVVAYTDTGMAEVKTTVTFDGKDVDFDADNNTFKGVKDGVYTVTYVATAANAAQTEYTVKISVGDVEGPAFKVDTKGRTAANATLTVNKDNFTFGKIKLDEDEDDVTITKKLYDSAHNEVTDATVKGSYTANKDKENNGTAISLTTSGDYTVEYIVADKVGNEVKYSYSFTVVADGSSTPTLWTPLSTVLIIVAIVLLAGVIVYVVRFRKVKK